MGGGGDTGAWDASTAAWSTGSANVGAEGVKEVDVDDSATASVAASGAWPSAASSAAVNGEYRYDQDAVAGGRFTRGPPPTPGGGPTGSRPSVGPPHTPAPAPLSRPSTAAGGP